MNTLPTDKINVLHILKVRGCGSGDHADIDPYYDAEDWHEAARGDGRSYSPLQCVYREPGESWEDFWARVEEKALEWDRFFHCHRCYR